MRGMKHARLIRIAFASLLGLAVAAGIAWWQLNTASRMATSGLPGLGGPFTLVDHTGRTVTQADFGDRLRLMYFGYTYCPDVCPTELSAMAGALDRLGPAAERVQPLFISIDPQRDTVSHMKDYVVLFHPRLVGLTGTPEQVQAAAKAYRVYYAKAPGGGADDYLMDHSSFVYLVSPAGAVVTVFPAKTTPDAMAEGIRARL